MLLPTVYRHTRGSRERTLERPGLQRLLADIERRSRRPDCGLQGETGCTRKSSPTFAKLVEARLEAAGAVFVSVRRCCTARSKSLTSLCRS